MQIPKFTRNYWIFILCLIGIGLALFVFCFSNYSTSQSPVQQIAITPSITQTPAVSTTIINMNTSNTSKFVSLTPYIAPYKIIPRNTTYTPSKPLMEPIDPNHQYSININPSISDHGIRQGSIFEISGTTDLPVGSDLLVNVGTTYYGPSTPTILLPIDRIYEDNIKPTSCYPAFMMAGKIYVEPPLLTPHTPTLTLNTWRFIVDSQMLLPNEYLVSVQSLCKSNEAYTIIPLLEPFDNEDLE